MTAEERRAAEMRSIMKLVKGEDKKPETKETPKKQTKGAKK